MALALKHDNYLIIIIFAGSASASLECSLANADLTSESGERRLVSQPMAIGRVTAHNPVNCILVILTPSCEC